MKAEVSPVQFYGVPVSSRAIDCHCGLFGTNRIVIDLKVVEGTDAVFERNVGRSEVAIAESG